MRNITVGRQKQYDRNEKLMEAVRIFWKKGYHNVSVNDLVKELGLGKRSFYQDFGSKEELYIQGMKIYAGMGRETVGQFLTKESTLPDLEKSMNTVLDITAYDPDVKSCMMSNTALELGNISPEIASIVEFHMKSINSAFGSVLSNAQKKGEIAEGLDPSALGILTNIIFSGAGIATRGGIPIKDVKKSIDLYFQLIKTS